MLDLGLDQKTILVTGASGGIGWATARALGDAGARVVLHGHSRIDELRARAGALPWAGRAHVVGADVRDPGALEAALEPFGRLHGCVVNAGIWPEEHVALVDMDEGRLGETLGVNVLGAAWTARAFLRSLRRGEPSAGGHGPSIAFIGSTAASFGERGHADYAASKAALVGLMRTLKNEIVELDPYGRANVVQPGWTVTERTAATLDAPGTIEGTVRTMALQQLAAPDDIARTVLWLMSPTLSRHVSGEVITVAGGMEGRVLREAGEVDAEAVRARLDQA